MKVCDLCERTKQVGRPVIIAQAWEGSQSKEYLLYGKDLCDKCWRKLLKAICKITKCKIEFKDPRDDQVEPC